MLVKLPYAVISTLIPILCVTVPNSAYGEQLSGSVRSASEVQFPKTSVIYLLRVPRERNSVPRLGQAISDVVSVTDVKVNATDKGIELILVTTNSEKLQVKGRIEGNFYIADIPNAKLQLTSGESFQQLKPVVGIAEVTVASQDAKTLRVTVVGETGAPTVELFDSTQEGLVFGVLSTASTAQTTLTETTPLTQQQTTPESKPKPIEDKQHPIELEVIGAPDDYFVPDATTATKTPTQQRDIPATVQVFPRQVIRDLGANTLGEVLRNFGIGPARFPSRTTDVSTSIRGFGSQADRENFLLNGLRDYAAATAFASDPGIIERIEVLRGPASVLYGQALPGGIVNLVTKQPLQEPYYALQFQTGSYSFYRGAIDLSAPLTSDKKVSYRFNAAYTNAESFIDFQETEKILVAPVISWQLGENTKLTFEAEYRDLNQAFFDNGLPARGTVLPNPNGKLPRSRYLGELSLDNLRRVYGRIDYNLEHRFSDNWSLRNAFRFVTATILEENSVLYGALQGDNRTLTRLVD